MKNNPFVIKMFRSLGTLFLILFMLQNSFAGVGNKKKRLERQAQQQAELDRQKKETEMARQNPVVPPPQVTGTPTAALTEAQIRAQIEAKLRFELELKLKMELAAKEKQTQLEMELRFRKEMEEKTMRQEIEMQRLRNETLREKDLRRQIEEERIREESIRKEVMEKIMAEQRQKDLLRQQILQEEKLKEKMRQQIIEEMKNEAKMKEKLKAELREEQLKKKTKIERELAKSTPGFPGALDVAKSIFYLVSSLRETYTEMVVSKLQKDGYGSALNVSYLKGFVPLPADYIHQIASSLVPPKGTEAGYFFEQKSLFNLNRKNRLNDAFEKEGWNFLVNQQEEHLKSQEPLEKILWRPYIKIEKRKGKKIPSFFCT